MVRTWREVHTRLCERTKGRFAFVFKVFLSVPFLNKSLASERSCDFRTELLPCVWAQTCFHPGWIWKAVWGVRTKRTSSIFLALGVAWTNRSGAASSSGLAASNTSFLQACWVVIKAANENQRLTKAELMTSVLSSPSAPQQVTRCRKNTCQTPLWEMKSSVWVGGWGVASAPKPLSFQYPALLTVSCCLFNPTFGEFNHLTHLWRFLVCVLVVLRGPPSANKQTHPHLLPVSGAD